jgi:hypothetical protein
MTSQPTRVNGGSLDEQSKAVEAGLAMHLRVKAELEDARRHNSELQELLTRCNVEIEALRSFNTLLESRVESAIAARDLAVGQRAKYESLFAMIMATMREFNIPAVPLIRELESHNAH